jgi:hypothetical protein
MTGLLCNGWGALIVRVDGVLVLIMNVWWALIVRVDGVLVLVSLTASVSLFFLCDMPRG